MGILERIARPKSVEQRYSVDQWIGDYLKPSQFSYNNNSYPLGLNQTLAGQRIQQVAATLPGYMSALRNCPPAFAAEMVRALVLSQARFVFRNRPGSRTPRRLFGTTELAKLETPWPNGTTGDLLTLMEWHSGLAGTAFVVQQPSRMRVIRPDWTAVVYGSHQEPDDAAHALDGEVIGYIYQNGGIGSGRSKPVTLLPSEVATWAPIPDPERPGLGQSWVTAALADIQGDRAATQHKLRFFENGATPNMVVKGITAATKEQFLEIVDAMESKHAGVANAYRTLYLAAGADATVVGADLKQLDFKATQGAGETRIAMLGRVPAPLLQISEGLAGSSLNAGNFGMARRIFADSWVYPTLQDLSAALAPLLKVPADAELWFDTADIPLLREDAKDQAEIAQTDANTIGQLVRDGFTADSAKAAVIGRDMSLLVHSGLVSVQLQEPGSAPGGVPPGKAPAAGPAARGTEARRFNPAQPRDGHGRWSHGMPGNIAVHDLKVDGGHIGIAADAKDPSDTVRMTIGDDSQTLTTGNVRELRSAVIAAQYDDKPQTAGAFTVTRAGAENVDGEKLSAGVDLKSPGASIRMSRKQSDALIEQLENAAAADRMETGFGPLDVFVAGKKRIGFRMRGDNGPAEVSFSKAEWGRLATAIADAEDGFDADGKDVGDSLTVATAAGKVQVSFHGKRQDNGFDPGSTLTIEPLYTADWGMAFDGAHIAESFLKPIYNAGLVAGVTE